MEYKLNKNNQNIQTLKFANKTKLNYQVIPESMSDNSIEVLIHKNTNNPHFLKLIGLSIVFKNENDIYHFGKDILFL